MLRSLLAALIVCLAAWTANADTLSAADRAEFQRIITGQIEAFRADDGERAYGYAAPGIRRIFPNSSIFMQMVKQGYRPVYRPQSFSFEPAGADPLGQSSQRVRIIGPDGKTYEALYSMERQPDGTWRISGCALVEVPEADA